jgi:hypothetical protein
MFKSLFGREDDNEEVQIGRLEQYEQEDEEEYTKF